MKAIRIVSVIVICILLHSHFVAISKSACLNPHSWDEDPKVLINGYCDRGFYIFGYITSYTARIEAPPHSIGSVVWFNPNKMEETAAINGTDLTGYLDGVALMSCSDVGKVVSLKRSNGQKEGPFIVTSCAWQSHMFGSICYVGEVAELGFKTAERWGMVHLVDGKRVVSSYREDDVEVFIDGASEGGIPIDYRSWWLKQVEFTSGRMFKDMGVTCKP